MGISKKGRVQADYFFKMIVEMKKFIYKTFHDIIPKKRLSIRMSLYFHFFLNILNGRKWVTRS